MPLVAGKSNSAVSRNIEIEMGAGKPQKQAIAIAESEKRKARDKRRRRAKDEPEIEMGKRGVEIETDDEPDAEAEEWELEALDEAMPDFPMSPPPPEPEPEVAPDTPPPAPVETPRLAFDRGSLRTKDGNGFMHVRDCRISKANVCPYVGHEIPESKELGLDDNTIYDLYRDPAELEKAAPTFERIPLMMHHVGVSATNPQKDLCIGTVSNVRWQAPYLVADLTVWDAEGIKAIESEAQQELSPGYAYKPVMNSGVFEGKAFDGRMTKIKANHLAIVDTGRTGPDVLVNDSAPQLH